MTELITMRGDADCAVCCLAMHFKCSWERAVEVCGPFYRPGEGVGRLTQCLYRFDLRAQRDFYFFEVPPFDSVSMREFVWGRRALITVPSLNQGDGKWHLIYYDGLELFDPSLRKRYNKLAEIMPVELVLFNEHRL